MPARIQALIHRVSCLFSTPEAREEHRLLDQFKRDPAQWVDALTAFYASKGRTDFRLGKPRTTVPMPWYSPSGRVFVDDDMYTYVYVDGKEMKYLRLSPGEVVHLKDAILSNVPGMSKFGEKHQL